VAIIEFLVTILAAIIVWPLHPGSLKALAAIITSAGKGYCYCRGKTWTINSNTSGN